MKVKINGDLGSVNLHVEDISGDSRIRLSNRQCASVFRFAGSPRFEQEDHKHKGQLYKVRIGIWYSTFEIVFTRKEAKL
jgi:hypothetical protein